MSRGAYFSWLGGNNPVHWTETVEGPTCAVSFCSEFSESGVHPDFATALAVEKTLCRFPLRKMHMSGDDLQEPA